MLEIKINSNDSNCIQLHYTSNVRKKKRGKYNILIFVYLMFVF